MSPRPETTLKREMALVSSIADTSFVKPKRPSSKPVELTVASRRPDRSCLEERFCPNGVPFVGGVSAIEKDLLGD